MAVRKVVRRKVRAEGDYVQISSDVDATVAGNQKRTRTKVSSKRRIVRRSESKVPRGGASHPVEGSND